MREATIAHTMCAEVQILIILLQTFLLKIYSKTIMKKSYSIGLLLLAYLLLAAILIIPHLLK
jgi:hypothetical protein